MKMKVPARVLWTACVFTAASLAPTAATAQSSYPNKPIRLVVPFPPGASTDIFARLFGNGLARELKATVVVENRPGANGNIGARLVAKAAPDGYTLLNNTSSFILSPALYINPGYDPIRDFAPVVGTVTYPLVFVTSNSLPVATLKELVTYAKQNPGKLDYGSSGLGGGTHLGAQRFFDANGIEARHVPYKGGAQALVDLAGGRVHFYAGTLAATSAFINDKRVRPLAVAGLKRLASLPNVPTVSETVTPGFEAGLWHGIVAPANTPPEIIALLNATIVKVLSDPDVISKIDAGGALPVGSSPARYGAHLKAELEREGKAIRAAGIKPE